jgi:putative transposase
MDLPVRKKLRHTIPQWVAEGSRFFITINCMPPGKNQLCRADRGDAVLTGIKFNHEKFVSHYRLCLLMPDHLDAVMRSRASREWTRSSGTGRSSSLEKHGLDWQRDFFDHRLRNHTNCKRRTSYILMTPVRKGLCERAEDWLCVYRPNERPPPNW